MEQFPFTSQVCTMNLNSAYYQLKLKEEQEHEGCLYKWNEVSATSKNSKNLSVSVCPDAGVGENDIWIANVRIQTGYVFPLRSGPMNSG